MSERTEYKPGTFCWPELVASDADKAKEFYQELFGWDIVDNAMGSDQVYSMASLKCKNVGGIYEMFSEQRDQGIPSHWASYISVSDVEETVDKAKTLGANVVVEPMDVFDAGRMAGVVDPTGGFISFWQPLKHIGAELVNENGALIWNEFMTNDVEKAKDFYTELIGWSSEDEKMMGMDYIVLKNGETLAGGIMALPEECGEMLPFWAIYFAVDDCDATVEKATSLGAEVFNPPMDLEGIGRMAALKDPQGAVFSIIKVDNLPD